MSRIKEHIKLLILAIVILLISSGYFYYHTILSPQLTRIQALKESNKEKGQEIIFLKQEAKHLSKRQDELLQLQANIKKIQERVPTYHTLITIMMDLMTYMESSCFQDIDIAMGESVKSQAQDYYEIPVTISYTSNYGETVNFLEKINRIQQIAKVDYLKIHHQQEETGELVRTQMILFLYYTDREDQKLYPNFMAFLQGSSNPFLISEASKEEVVE